MYAVSSISMPFWHIFLIQNGLKLAAKGVLNFQASIGEPLGGESFPGGGRHEVFRPWRGDPRGANSSHTQGMV